jgi:hypothetical protein
MESGSTPPDGKLSDRIPRGAIVVVVVGLLATVAAALLTTGKGSGEAAHLEFVQGAKIPNSKPVAIPGGEKFQMQLVTGNIKATGTNVSGRMLFRAVSEVKIDEGAPIGGGRILCSIHAPASGTEITQSSGGLRMLYPRSSEEGIYGQPVPLTVLAQFASHGYELAVLEQVTEDLPPRWASIKGVKLEWPEFEEGTEHLHYFLPEGKAKATVVLPFYTIWTTQKRPAVQISCTLQVAAGKATVKTEGSLKKVSPPINEEAEEAKQEEREENGETAADTREAEEAEESEGE